MIYENVLRHGDSDVPQLWLKATTVSAEPSFRNKRQSFFYSDSVDYIIFFSGIKTRILYTQSYYFSYV